MPEDAPHKQPDTPQARSLFTWGRVKMPRRAQDGAERQDEGLYDFLLTEQGKRWLAGVIRREQELRGDYTPCFLSRRNYMICSSDLCINFCTTHVHNDMQVRCKRSSRAPRMLLLKGWWQL